LRAPRGLAASSGRWPRCNFIFVGRIWKVRSDHFTHRPMPGESLGDDAEAAEVVEDVFSGDRFTADCVNSAKGHVFGD